MSTASTGTTVRPDATTAVAQLIRFLETGVAPDGLFMPEVFADLSLPQWRVQASGVDEVVAIRVEGHPSPGQVHVVRVDPTDRGFAIEFEERWEQDGQRWYCREMIRADVVGAAISELSVYCTGDWDEAKQREHAAAVRLIRP
jgi:hypothetical protein